MVDFDKAIKTIDEKIIELEKEKESIKNFNNYDLIGKFEIVKKTDLRYQREEVAQVLLKSFKSKIIREKGIAQIMVNHFVIDVDGFKICIPMYLSKIICIGYVLEDVSKDSLHDVNSQNDKLLSLEKELNSLMFFNFNKKKKLNRKIESLKSNIRFRKKQNEKIINENKLKDERIKHNKKILLAIKEDIDLFKSNGYTFQFTIDSVYNHSLI